MSLLDWIDLSAQLECNGLELYTGFFQSQAPEYLRGIRQRIESLGMVMPMICHSPDFTVPDANQRQNEVKKQIAMIQLTAEMGGSFCRTLSGQGRPGLSEAEGIAWVVDCIQQCLPEAEKSGVQLVMENHYRDGAWHFKEFAQKKEVFLAIINHIDSPYFGVQFDPSNAIVAGDDPLDLMEEVKWRIKTMHASDRYLAPGATLEDLKEADGTIGYSPKLCHGVIGKGLNDYKGMFTILKEVQFSGWISVEDGMNGLAEMKESVDFLKKMRADFSAA